MAEERFTTRVAVFVIVRNDKGEILLHQRAPGRYLAGYWDFPSGHGERDESLVQSAVRELKEEVDLDGRVEDLRLVHIEQYFVEVNYLNFVFALDKWSGTPRICEPDKCSAIGWFAPDALPEKCVNAVQAAAMSGFTDQLTYSITDRKTYEQTMGLPKQAA
ncbi:MAG TPA: NUDIX domain-containing protein [Candidatus Saccharimonadales bacterium]|nr:NUDIX domain-containing protein [Candidatus Saccharimonadales bacterium]